MFSSTVLDVAIGLVFVYILLGMICTAIGELIEVRLKQRSKELERGIRELLIDRNPDKPDEITSSVIAKFYNHPLISGLFEGRYEDADAPRKGLYYNGTAKLPSYIPSRNFALALMDLVLPADSERPATAAGASESGAAEATKPDSPTQAGSPKALQALRDAVSSFHVDSVKRALLPLIDAAGGDVDRARKNIEDWFDGTMDRVSGWYKRHAQKIAIFIALGLTCAMNVDSIEIARTLSRDQKMRETLVAAATQKISVPQIVETPKDQTPAQLNVARQKQAEKTYRDTMTEIDGLSLPIGWSADDPRLNPTEPGAIIVKILGLLLTAAAVTLGAPFWFDVLNKIMVIRSTVKPKEKSPDEPPVDGPKPKAS